jgi:hypothetical protein
MAESWFALGIRFYQKDKKARELPKVIANGILRAILL